MSEPERPLSVDDVILAPEGSRVGARATNSRERNALLQLSQAVAHNPDGAVQQLALSALSLTDAESAGMTLEEVVGEQLVLRWVAIAGIAKSYQGVAIPRDFSPCGEAMNRRQSLIMQEPARYFGYLRDVDLPIRTALLVPFARRGKFVGTLWVIRHSGDRIFTRDHQDVVENLATFAGAILDAQERGAGRQTS